MTGYSISVGYNSAHHDEDVWEYLVEVVKQVRSDAKALIDEVLAVEHRPEGASLEDLRTHAEHYSDCDDLTLKIYDTPPDYLTTEEQQEEWSPYIYQCASSGNGFRGLKEQMRRAFCRIVLGKMHEKGMEVNINVT